MCSAQCAGSKSMATARLVSDFQSLTFGPKHHGVLTDNVSSPRNRKTNRAWLARRAL
jgi:hypothetical protein